MANVKNLIPQNKRTKKKQREIAKKGGKASGKARKQAKTFKELTQAFLATHVEPSDEIMKKIKELFPNIKKKELTARFAMIMRQIEKAIKKGDSKAFEVIRDTAGEKPANLLGSDPDNPLPENNNIFDLSKLTDKDLQKLVAKIDIKKQTD